MPHVSAARPLRLPMVITVLVAGTLSAVEAQAESPPGEDTTDTRRNEVLTLQVENDVFFDTDRDYTNGLRLSYGYEPHGHDKALDARISRLLLGLSPVGSRVRREGGGHVYYTLGIGQNMYTPDDITVSDIIPEDRPYAGWTYLEFGMIAEDSRNFEAWKLDIGLIGPASGAGWTQRRWHEVIDSDRPEGWANQLPNEPGVNLHYVRGWRRWITGGGNSAGRGTPLQVDMMPHVGAALGNVYTHASAGITFRIGTNLTRDVGSPPRIQPAMPGSELYRGSGFDFYLFAGGEGRAVARNIFLDGTWRSHPHSVDSETFVADLQVGAVLLAGQWRLALTRAWRTREYETSDIDQEYAAITLSRRF
ncbi:lipid A deacylase LpxR family protein [Eilatimonas milleporae]|uniref:Lipid A deacylase LpxR family protein n=1 Tax=Eilatimonas milleporae TaxID=911205 RepID=A0A3M0CX58_9PROT|nr:lipid A deacylase LpxR family protein [Eilatimonas milleporae]RMB12046.1 hypothetical protein BXY39_0536 [Eilatimonas milleporae]